MRKEAKDAKRKAKEEAYKRKWEEKLAKAQKQLDEMKAGEEVLTHSPTHSLT
jgi:preprotein translocase subunit YajC